mgnify:CR=1 FL=1
MKEDLIRANNELQQIFVRGIDAIHMTNALMILDNLIQKSDEPKEEPPAED